MLFALNISVFMAACYGGHCVSNQVSSNLLLHAYDRQPVQAREHVVLCRSSEERCTRDTSFDLFIFIFFLYVVSSQPAENVSI